MTATVAWVDWQRGRLRPAITAMKRAYPEWVGEAGERLPREVWQVLFPIRFDQELLAAAREDGLDPALVAALILQESSYDPGALSGAGARGLMQVMPATGRTIARAKGVRFKRAALHDPATSLDFGTHYLSQMSERYAGAVEKVLAAYNAGPHRVDAWTLARGEQPRRGLHRDDPVQRDPQLRDDRAREPGAVPPALRPRAHRARTGGRRPQAVSFRLGDFRPQIDPKLLTREPGTRSDGRGADELRPRELTTGFLKHAEGSCLVEVGDTRVVCAASFEDKVPPFLKGKGEGWVTAEYGMLPRATTPARRARWRRARPRAARTRSSA